MERKQKSQPAPAVCSGLQRESPLRSIDLANLPLNVTKHAITADVNNKSPSEENECQVSLFELENWWGWTPLKSKSPSSLPQRAL